MDYLSVARYNPEVEHASSIAASFDAFDNSSLSETTHVDRVTYQSHLPRRKSQLKSTAEIQALRDYEDLAPAHEFFFIYKYLVHSPTQGVPADANKLRISRSSFEALATRLKLPPAFVFALSRHYLPNGRGSRKLQLSDGSVAFDLWYFLPVRVQVKATSPQIKDAVAEGDGSEWPNQMNPFHRLHLPAVKLNILRSCVAIFSRVHPNTKKVTFMAVDFMHGRWPSVAMEPQQRIDEAMQRAIQDIEGPGCFPDLVYLSSAVRWWTNALNSVNEQLIAYELRLQTTGLRGSGWETIASETEFANINPALHSIAAHLHRYLSELKSLRCIAVNLLSHYKCVHTDKPTDEDPVKYDDDASRSISQLLSHIEATEDFANELEKKTQNILALLFNRIQIDNAKASHALAEEMKRDSIAMRAIAIVTMFFLPGATFAALLAMPFFSEDGWFSDVSKLWIWVVLTVPSTCACFAFYKIWRVRARRELAYTEGIPLGAMP